MYKLAILIRQDLKMPKGKLAVQYGHAVADAVIGSSKKTIEEWRKEGMPKIALKVDDLKELKSYQEKAKKEKLKTYRIKDAGKTFFSKPTITCLAIGPDKEEKIDKITSKLKLL